jgi:uncharacterized protein
MHAFYFGTSKAPLFGVYHPPRGTSPRDHGVVLCYPWGQEYMRGHRAFRQLAFGLTRAGFHVLRFDYFGTGDSGGSSEEGAPEQWLADLDAAIDELQDMADITTVSLVGARIGAALAARVAERRDGIAGVVLWDPVVTGAAYLDEILSSPGAASTRAAGNGAAVNGNGVAVNPAAVNSVAINSVAINSVNGTAAIGDDTVVLAAVNGFPVTRRMHTQVAALDVCAMRPAAKDVHVIVSHERPEYERLRDALGAAAGVRSSYEHIPARGNWNEVDNFGSALLPQEVIQGIVKWFEERDT